MHRRLAASIGREGLMTNSSWVKCKAVKMAFNRLWLSSTLINRGEELHMISRSNMEVVPVQLIQRRYRAEMEKRQQ